MYKLKLVRVRSMMKIGITLSCFWKTIREWGNSNPTFIFLVWNWRLASSLVIEWKFLCLYCQICLVWCFSVTQDIEKSCLQRYSLKSFDLRGAAKKNICHLFVTRLGPKLVYASKTWSLFEVFLNFKSFKYLWDKRIWCQPS